MSDQRIILVIDDDARNIFALTAVLQAKGFACLSASDASQGMAMLHEHQNIGIILLDMMMPGIDGYEALAQFKQQHNLPVIAVTAQAMTGDREKCLAAGADDYVPKPINVDLLLQVVKRHT